MTLSVSRGALAIGIASLVLTSSAVAQIPPLNNQWVEFEQDNSLLQVSPSSLSNNSNETDLAWGDLDQNGFIDLVIVRKEPFTSAGKRTNVLLMNYGGGLTNMTSAFASASDVPGDMGFNTPTNDRDVVLSDVDNDGWLDVVTATTLSTGEPKHIGHPRIYVNLGQSGGTWLGLRHEDARAPQMVHFATGMPENPRFCGVDAGDVTGDGFDDLYFADYDSGPGANLDMNDRLWVNDGTGHFLDKSQLSMTPAMLQSAFGTSVTMGDFNLDGAIDVMKDTTLGTPTNVSVAYNNPSNLGVFNLLQSVHTFAPYHVNSGDLNNDGRLDIVVSDDGDDKYRYNTGTDAFGQATWSAALEYAGGGECDATGCTDDGFGSNNLIVDIDGDGWNDVVVADVDVDIGGYGRRAHIFHNPGGSIGQQILLREEQQSTNDNSGWKGVVGMTPDDLRGTHDIAVFDVDNDGDNDIVISRYVGTFVWRNKANDTPQVCAINVGSQGPGSSMLSLCGTGFGTGGINSLNVTNAPPSANAYLFVSLPGGTDLPFLGGTLASITNLIPGFPLPFATDVFGNFQLPVAGGAGPFSVVIQAIVRDANQPAGFAITNAIKADFLP